MKKRKFKSTNTHLINRVHNQEQSNHQIFEIQMYRIFSKLFAVCILKEIFGKISPYVSLSAIWEYTKTFKMRKIYLNQLL